MNPLAHTSCWTAAARAVETARTNPLFKDMYAHYLAGFIGYEFLNTLDNGDSPFIAIRTTYFDHLIHHFVHIKGIKQIVLFGAGMDSRAFRLNLPASVHLFEIDVADIFEYKEPIIGTFKTIHSCKRSLIQSDFFGDWESLCMENGFNATQPSLFLAEGIFYYFTEETAQNLIARISQFVAQYSFLVCDILNEDFLYSSSTQHVLSLLRNYNVPWLSGTNDPQKFFNHAGFEVLSHLEPGEPAVHYGRWPYFLYPRSYPNIPRTFFAVCQKWIPDTLS